MIFALLALQAAAEQPMRYEQMAQKIAELRVAKIGCRPRDMLLDERAFNLFVVQSTDAAFREGTNQAEAVSIAYAAEQAEKKAVDEGGGDLTKVGTSAPAMTRYTEFWQRRCGDIQKDAFMAKFFGRRADQKPTIPEGPPREYAGRMCYKDYCPCLGKQSSLDKMLCDRLEENLPVDVETMISGRSLRAAKEELDAFK